MSSFLDNHTLTLFVVLLKVLLYPFKKLVWYVILLSNFYFDYNFNFYIFPIQIKYIPGGALLNVFIVFSVLV